jgi:hypothetical protein
MMSQRQDTTSIVRHNADPIVVRDAYADDALPLLRLAALDSRPALRGRVLMAEVDGELVAATSISNGRTIADPWRHTADLVALLELRAEQIRQAETWASELSLRSRAVGSRSGSGAARCLDSPEAGPPWCSGQHASLSRW